jgi:hypothetical protein
LDISYCDLLLKKTKCVSFSFSHFIFSWLWVAEELCSLLPQP